VAEDVQAAQRAELDRDGKGLRVAVVCALFNDHITQRLLDGVHRGLRACAVDDADVTVEWVPGSFELPLAAKAFAAAGAVDAVICLGCVIRGDTAHFEHVGTQCARGLQEASLATGVPVLFGVLTTEDLDQALARSEPAGGHNVGEESAEGAVAMARLLQRVRTKV
jgi:6,7-dimethyl-8-ribityllumazine synthase